ncbi:hypothetical protein NHE_0114 [Neorickettsia helminthoeca str. Oregon]|uniref:PAS fold family protein n=1 Tax=Neorickettsia helminthoeca str. Oregon TaxID=1286528 RepID=X5HJ49_9RICK|nr:PAS domain-containing protein [Neorickettsia helminthoeca]AHX11084.1 hypothetical protein NHE_0114 [Neorickettsia helminthoeca str. Oregon]
MEISIARRKSDLVISIVQDNNDKTVMISDANEALLSLLFYTSSELKGRPFFDILEQKDRDRILEHLEYEEYGIDIESILTRLRELSLKSKHGANIPVKIKIFPSSSASSREKRYQILAREYGCIDHLADFRRSCDHFEYSINDTLRIMDSQSTEAEIVLLSRFCKQYRQNCVVGFIQLSDSSRTSMLQVIEILKKSIRSTDQIGAIGRVIVVFIIGCEPQIADRPMSRIISKVRQFDKGATLKYFNLLEHPVLNIKDDLVNRSKIYASSM